MHDNASSRELFEHKRLTGKKITEWPLSSLYLNLIENLVSILKMKLYEDSKQYNVENITNMTSHNTKASLIVTIHRVFAKLPPALVEKACSQFRIRIKVVIEAEGGYTE